MLVTGGTGAFGRAFIRRQLQMGNHRICVYSRDEYKQHQLREEFGTHRVRYFVGDVRDKERLMRAMRGCSEVIHAAALKRIETCHYNPTEMVKTNVQGTMNVIEAAESVPSVRTVVYLSTDKAYQPVSAYGYSKALGESLMLAANDQVGPNGPDFCVTRYGNVAGSTGSVIPVWREAKKKNWRIDITDPDCTRFWMYMDEAVELVLQTLATKVRLNIPTLPAFRLGDLAEAMDLEPNVIGLPAHEKIHETLQVGFSSDTARRMTVEELREALQRI